MTPAGWGLVFAGACAFFAVWGFLFYQLFAWMKEDTALQESRHQLRLTRIRAGLPPD